MDGNNVMGQRVGWHRDRAGARRRLVAELAELCRSGDVGVLVVFDGPSERIVTSAPGLEVVFSGRGVDADTRIVELASTVPDAGAITAVTSDRDLRERLREQGVRSIRSGEFRRMLGD